MTHRFAWHATWGVVGVLMLALIALPFAGCGGSSAIIPPPADEGPDDGIPNVDPVTAALILAAWQGSGHSDHDAEAFRHWDEDGEIQISCARCHSTHGYRDYLGDDGSAAFSVDAAAALGTTVNCDACHNPTAPTLDQVIFPSGYIATDLGAEARCMTCHQGRESTVSMNNHIAGAEIVDDDTPDADLSFRNIHYFAAGATLYGGAVKGAYQYTLPGDDMVIGTVDDVPQYGFYDERNPHVAAADTCIECHDPHSLERRIDLCADCHAGVTSDADLRNIRMAGSVRDYDADGNATEGIYYEILTMTEVLYAAIQQYATNVLGAPIVYDSHAYPYFFKDTNGNGAVDPGEAIFPNRYTGWSARLLRAAYNYQYAKKDPGAFAHNPKYVIEFLYDSLANLNEHPQVTVPNFGSMFRNDSGHFDAGAYAFRRWDRIADDTSGGAIDAGDVQPSCARCHSPGGFDFWAEHGLDVTSNQTVGDGFRCEQCHVEGADYTGVPEVKYVGHVEFPKNGVEIDNDPGDPDHSFLCMSCHIGRESGASVDAEIAGGAPFSFKNIHYLPAGATLYGSTGGVGYEYGGKTYEVKWNHFLHSSNPGGNSAGSQCNFCHLADHTFLPQATSNCVSCHGSGPLQAYRFGIPMAIEMAGGYDQNAGTATLGLEIDAFAARLFTAMQTYATANLPVGIVYDSHAYPYFFKDNNGNNMVDPGEAIYPNQYRDWDAPLLRASFNYQFSQKEPGAWAHNFRYMLQLLYDSIEDIEGAPPAGLTRP